MSRQLEIWQGSKWVRLHAGTTYLRAVEDPDRMKTVVIAFHPEDGIFLQQQDDGNTINDAHGSWDEVKALVRHGFPFVKTPEPYEYQI